MSHSKSRSIVIIGLILAISLVLIQVAGCSKAPPPVYFIQVFKARPVLPPSFAEGIWIMPPNPNPEHVQEVLNPGDKIYIGLVINRENKENITFSKYTIFGRDTGQEIEVGVPGELGPFEPGRIAEVAFDNPWAVPEQLGIYELRVYMGDEVVASAVFEVKKHDPIDSIGVSRARPGDPPSLGQIEPKTPHPDFVQEVLSPGDKIYLGLVINDENKEAITFSKYTFYEKATGRELVLETTDDLGPFQPGQITLIAFDHPWPVPEQPGIYEVRIYMGNDIVASALFLVTCNRFYSDKYDIEVQLPSGWAAVEGPENLVLPRYEGLVAFNSWGQDDFWARGVNYDTDTHSIIYSPYVVAAQVPNGGAYVALVEISGPPYINHPPPEYELGDLSGLYQPHDWREVGASACFKTFYRNGIQLQLEIYCHPDASDETVTELNDLLRSWRFVR